MTITKETKCFLCNTNIFNGWNKEGLSLYMECPACGIYGMTDTLLAVLDANKDMQLKFAQKGYILAGLSREINNRDSKPLLFRTDNIEEYLESSEIPNIDSIEVKSNLLLSFLRKNSDRYMAPVKVYTQKIFPIAYAKSVDEFEALLSLLKNKGLILYSGNVEVVNSVRKAMVSLTADGWELAGALSKVNKKSKKGFIAIKFEDTEENNKKIACIESCVREAGFEPMCIKHKDYNETVMNKALGEIRESRFVIADITDGSPAVAHEAGFADGLGIVVIYLHQVGDDGVLPAYFYAKHYKICTYRNFEELKDKLTPAVKARIEKY